MITFCCFVIRWYALKSDDSATPCACLLISREEMSCVRGVQRVLREEQLASCGFVSSATARKGKEKVSRRNTFESWGTGIEFDSSKSNDWSSPEQDGRCRVDAWNLTGPTAHARLVRPGFWKIEHEARRRTYLHRHYYSW